MIKLKDFIWLLFKAIMYTTGIVNLLFVCISLIFEITNTTYHLRSGYQFKLLTVSIYIISAILLMDLVVYVLNRKNRENTIIYRYIMRYKNGRE